MLEGRRCAECGKVVVEGKRPCPFCGSQGGTAVQLSGRAELLSWTVIRVAPARFATEAPYTVGVLRLDEGPRLTARVEGDPEQLAIGQRLVLASVDTARGPLFRTA
jgi:uncharacterized OB-fold protein